MGVTCGVDQSGREVLTRPGDSPAFAVTFGVRILLAHEAPGGMIGSWHRAALRALFLDLGREQRLEIVAGSFEGACFLESAVTTLLQRASSRGT